LANRKTPNKAVSRYNRYIAKGKTHEESILEVHRQSEKDAQIRNAPLYHYNFFTALNGLYAIQKFLHSQKDLKLRDMEVLMVVYKACYHDKNVTQNPSGWADAGVVTHNVFWGFVHRRNALKKLIKHGYIIRIRQKDLPRGVVKRSKPMSYVYQHTKKGEQLIKMIFKDAAKHYRQHNDGERLSYFDEYNYKKSTIHRVAKKFNRYRDTFDYDKPENQLLNLKIPNFKERFPPKD